MAEMHGSDLRAIDSQTQAAVGDGDVVEREIERGELADAGEDVEVARHRLALQLEVADPLARRDRNAARRTSSVTRYRPLGTFRL